MMRNILVSVMPVLSCMLVFLTVIDEIAFSKRHIHIPKVSKSCIFIFKSVRHCFFLYIYIYNQVCMWIRQKDNPWNKPKLYIYKQYKILTFKYMACVVKNIHVPFFNQL